MAELTERYLYRLFEDLERLPVGQILDLMLIKDEYQRSLYIEGVKKYIDGGHPEIEFNSNYTKVKRLHNF